MALRGRSSPRGIIQPRRIRAKAHYARLSKCYNWLDYYNRVQTAIIRPVHLCFTTVAVAASAVRKEHRFVQGPTVMRIAYFFQFFSIFFNRSNFKLSTSFQILWLKWWKKYCSDLLIVADDIFIDTSRLLDEPRTNNLDKSWKPPFRTKVQVYCPFLKQILIQAMKFKNASIQEHSKKFLGRRHKNSEVRNGRLQFFCFRPTFAPVWSNMDKFHLFQTKICPNWTKSWFSCQCPKNFFEWMILKMKASIFEKNFLHCWLFFWNQVPRL